MIGEDEDRRGEVTPGPPFCGGGETRNATPIGGIHSHLLRERGDDIPIILDHEGKAAVNMLKCGCHGGAESCFQIKDQPSLNPQWN